MARKHCLYFSFSTFRRFIIKKLSIANRLKITYAVDITLLKTYGATVWHCNVIRLRPVQTKLLRVVQFAEESKQARTIGDSQTQRSIQHKAFPVLNYLQLYDIAITIQGRVNVFSLSLTSPLSSCLFCSSQPIPSPSYLLPVVPTDVTLFLSFSLI